MTRAVTPDPYETFAEWLADEAAWASPFEAMDEQAIAWWREERYQCGMRLAFLSIGPNAARRHGFFAEPWQRIHDAYMAAS
jgi:hypothetical protein